MTSTTLLTNPLEPCRFACLTLGVLLSLTGCGDDSPSGGGGQGGSGSGGGGAGGGGVIDPTPILEREPAISHTCSELRPMTQPAGAMSTLLGGLVELGGHFYVVESTDVLELSEITLDGDWSNALTLNGTPFEARQATATIVGGDVVAAWTQGNSTQHVGMARVAPNMTFVAGPLELTETGASASSVAAIVPHEDGSMALLFGASSGGGQTTLRYLNLDADLTSAGAPVDVDSFSEAYFASAGAAPTADGGLAVAYAADQEIRFVVLDASGTPRFAPKRISRAAGGGWSSSMEYAPRANVIAVGDHTWVAFTERYAIEEQQMGHGIVRVADVDAEGNATLHALEAPVDQLEQRWPSFVTVDDRIGIVWTKGSITWICAGCISDYDMSFMLLDPAGLVPASERVTHLHTTNGIVAPMAVVSGGDILDAAVLDFHALTLPASGAIHCE